MNKDELYMRRALDLALNGTGFVSPNPLVGAVIVHEDRVIGEGWHEKYGGPHAEVNAIMKVENEDLLSESTMYVTLEPCAHYGKTPPCADLLIEKKFRRVVTGMTDPNPRVGGKGIARIREAGIEVVTDVLLEACMEMNVRFISAFAKDRPYIILKWAQTRNGFIARQDYSSKWISGASSRQLVHKWRTEEDAILIGPETAIRDNPALTAREWPGKNPLRVVLDRFGRVPPEAKLFTDGSPTLYYTTIEDDGSRNCTCVRLSEESFLSKVFSDLKHRGILSVLVEGGSAIHHELLRQDLWDEVRVFTGEITFDQGIKAPFLPPGHIKSSKIEKDTLFIIKK